MTEKEKIQTLRKVLKPGDTVYTVLRYVSRSGMYRVISLLIVKKGEIKCIDYLAAELLEGWDRKHEGCKASGCGMDMGFHLVYNLGRVLFPRGFKTWPGYWRNEPLEFDKDGGYAFHQRWL